MLINKWKVIIPSSISDYQRRLAVHYFSSSFVISSCLCAFVVSSSMPRLPASFRALASRNYRLFLLGQGVSLIGTWMQQTGIQWLVYDTTHSPAMLGAVMFFGQIPALFLAPVAGVFSDQLDRRRTLFITQV